VSRPLCAASALPPPIFAPTDCWAEAQANCGGSVQLAKLFGISDPTRHRSCAEFGQRGYDEH
jgi:hypothetical protein